MKKPNSKQFLASGKIDLKDFPTSYSLGVKEKKDRERT